MVFLVAEKSITIEGLGIHISHMSLTHPYHSLPISSRLYSPDSPGDLNSRTVLGPKGQVKDILQEVISDPHIQALGTCKNGVNLGLWPKFEPRIWEHLADLYRLLLLFLFFIDGTRSLRLAMSPQDWTYLIDTEPLAIARLPFATGFQ